MSFCFLQSWLSKLKYCFATYATSNNRLKGVLSWPFIVLLWPTLMSLLLYVLTPFMSSCHATLPAFRCPVGLVSAAGGKQVHFFHGEWRAEVKFFRIAVFLQQCIRHVPRPLQWKKRQVSQDEPQRLFMVMKIWKIPNLMKIGIQGL